MPEDRFPGTGSHQDATLAILCGGRAERLGSDKGLYAPLGDEPLVIRALRLWRAPFAEVLVIVRDSDQRQIYLQTIAEHLGTEAADLVRVVCDHGDAGEGTADPAAPVPQPRAALTGVHTALRYACTSQVVVVPVDQVGVRAMYLRSLLAATAPEAGSNAHPVVYRAYDGSIFPFPSLWPTSLRPQLTARLGGLGGAELSVRDTLHSARPEILDAPDIRDELAFSGNSAAELASYFGQALFDPFKRRLHYLRFSLTEACNLSCTYCLPEGFPEWYRHKARLSTEHIGTLLRGFRQLGFRKVRFTGGEPTVHPGCLEAVKLARRLGFERIAMTTNGLLIHDLNAWVDAGLTDLNISLDTLDPEIFFKLAKSRETGRLQALVETASRLPLQVKINTVLLRSLNGSPASIQELIDWALGLNITLRFIELMQTGLNSSFAADERVLGTEIEPFLRDRGLRLVHEAGMDLRGPATDYAAPQHRGRIGLINPMSCNFCSKCNRLRITAKGRLKLCLFGDQDIEFDLASPAAVALNVRRLIDRKPERHYLDDGNYGNVATFRTIGG